MKDQLWQILLSTNSWVKYSDSKATALLGIQGILIGLIVAFVSNSFSVLSLKLYYSIFLLSGVFSILISALLAFFCLIPRLKNVNRVSPIYFKSIANNFQSASDYSEYLKENFNTEADISEYLSEQIYTNARIATNKFALASWSIRFLVAGLLFLMLFIIFMILEA